MFKKLSLAVLISAFFFASCKKEPFNGSSSTGDFSRSASADVDIDPRDFSSQPTATIPATITGTTVLTAGTTWLLDGPTYVSSTGRLEIDPGVLIKGVANPSRGNSSYLVVTPGGVIDADGGSASNSIVFTSDQVGSASPGDWGGIIILGNAQTNNYPAQIEGIVAGEVPSGYSITYGATGTGANTSSSGTLRYVRIEYAGRDLDNNGNEINGLTLGGVGSGTVLSHIQVSYGQDDAFEFFGGTVNADHLVAYGNNDDDFDFDAGYVGSIDYAVSLRDPNVALSSDPNGIEADNNASGTATTLTTNPQLNHFTILGQSSSNAALQYGAHWRRAVQFTMENSIITGYPDAAVFFNGAAVQTYLNTASGSYLTNAFVHSFTTPFIASSPSASSWTNVTGITNTTANPGLVNPFTIGNPDFRYTNSALSGIGAFGASGSPRWDDNWASYNPSFNSY